MSWAKSVLPMFTGDSSEKLRIAPDQVQIDTTHFRPQAPPKSALSRTRLAVNRTAVRAFTEKTESRGSPAGTNRIQGSYWNGGQHGWRNRIRRICVGALLVRGKMALPSRKLRSNLE